MSEDDNEDGEIMRETQTISTLKQSSKQLISPKNSTPNRGLPHTFSASELMLTHHLPSSLGQISFKNLFEPMPFSHLEIILQAQHPTKAIVGGRTIINKFLNQIFDSMTPSDWVLPFVVTTLLLFHAEDHKMRDLSHIFQLSGDSNCFETPITPRTDQTAQNLDISLAVASSKELNRLRSFSSSTSSVVSLSDFPTTGHIPSSTEQTPQLEEWKEVLEVLEWKRKVNPPEVINSSVPIFPIASFFPSYRFLSTVFVTQRSSSGSIFWNQTQLFLIDGFLFQCDPDRHTQTVREELGLRQRIGSQRLGRNGQSYLIPTGFIFLDENSVQWIEEKILVRGESHL
jgi:hypothetical protein